MQRGWEGGRDAIRDLTWRRGREEGGRRLGGTRGKQQEEVDLGGAYRGGDPRGDLRSLGAGTDQS